MNNKYIGARYVPIFGGAWDNTKAYEALVIVEYEGNSYTSKTYVPVGVAISNTTYWALTGNYNAQVEAYRQEVARLQESFDELGFVTAGQFGAKIDGVTDDTTAFQNMIASFNGENGCVTLQRGVHYIGTNLTIPANVVLKFVNGAMLKVGAGVTLTINSMFECDRYQIFNVVSTGSVVFGGKVSIAYPEWFGAKNDGTTDCATAFELCFNAVQNSNISLLAGWQNYSAELSKWVASERCYVLSRSVTFNKPFCKLSCDAPYAVLYTENNCALIIGSNSTGTNEYQEVENICVVCGNTNIITANKRDNSKYAVQFVGSQSSLYKNIRVIGSQLGFYFNNNIANIYERLSLTPAISGYTDGFGFYIDGSKANWSSHFKNCGVSGDKLIYNYVALNIDNGAEVRDLWFDYFETANIGKTFFIETLVSGYGNDITFNHFTADQCGEVAGEIVCNNDTTHIRFTDGYFQRVDSATTKPMINIHSDTNHNGVVSFTNCEFLDGEITIPTILSTGCFVRVNDSFFKNCGYSIDLMYGGVVSGNMFHNTYDTQFECFIKNKGDGLTITDNTFNNQSGNSNVTGGCIDASLGNANIMNNMFLGFMNAQIIGGGASVCINRQTPAQNAIPGFTHA
jgi:hypothetical protein